jgi:hypothetical protein
MEFLVLWVIMAAVCGMIANSKRLSFAKYFVMGMLFWPVGLVAAILAKPNEGEEIARGHRVRCPHCAELIRPEAIVCRYCTQSLAASTRLEVAGVVIRE